jgi:hypothetical protein
MPELTYEDVVAAYRQINYEPPAKEFFDMISRVASEWSAGNEVAGTPTRADTDIR